MFVMHLINSLLLGCKDNFYKHNKIFFLKYINKERCITFSVVICFFQLSSLGNSFLHNLEGQKKNEL